MTEDTSTLLHHQRAVSARATTAVGLLGIGLIHVLDAVGKWSETRYLFWMYIALIVGCIVVAAAVAFTHSRLSLVAAAFLALSALAGFVLSRTTGLPNATGDIGNWKEPLGLASMFVEAAVAVVALAGAALAAPARERVAARRHATLPQGA